MKIMLQGTLSSASNQMVMASAEGGKKLENKQRNIKTAFTYGHKLQYDDLE
jgi:hypothetical protein